MIEITWLGHGTFEFRLESGEVILLDPWLDGNPAHPKNHSLSRVDTVLISHGHFDHIHDAVSVANQFSPKMVAIFETGHWLESKGVQNVSGMNKGGTQQVGSVAVTMTHAVHSCGILDDGKIIYGGEAAGYVVKLPDNRTIYLAGDTNVFSDMALIEQLYQPDLAVLPIGDHFTMGPREAARCVQDAESVESDPGALRNVPRINRHARQTRRGDSRTRRYPSLAAHSRPAGSLVAFPRGLIRSERSGRSGAITTYRWQALVSSLVLLGAAPAACAAEEYAGARSCAPCHPNQAAAQAKSAHARALHTAASHPLVASFTRDTNLTREPGVHYRFHLSEGQLRVQAHDDRNEMDIPVEWAFGAGDQAVTFVTRIDKDWYLEHYHSYYSAIDRMAPTAGQSVLQAKTLPEAMGLPYKALDANVGILGCFECHSTGPVRRDAEQKLTPSETGVRCEACHGPGSAHIDAATRGSPANARALIRDPKHLSAESTLEFCGRCHRPPAAAGTKIDWNYAWNVRHQPVYLANSKCMIQSKGALSCLTCHDPHTSLRKSGAAFYRERCLSCHNGTQAALASRKACNSDCTACHMPKVEPQPALRFTNHWIGVYSPQSALRPAR